MEANRKLQAMLATEREAACAAGARADVELRTDNHKLQVLATTPSPSPSLKPNSSPNSNLHPTPIPDSTLTFGAQPWPSAYPRAGDAGHDPELPRRDGRPGAAAQATDRAAAAARGGES